MDRNKLLETAKPILFNSKMVQAILDGRKQCTRRIVKPQPDTEHQYPLGFVTDSTDRKTVGNFAFGTDQYSGSMQYAKPVYHKGDILYVRETVWQKTGHYLDVDGETKGVFCNEFLYAATDNKPEVGWDYSWAKRPSIHMPKSAARIFLKVTDVRMEKLWDIAEEQAKKEGCCLKVCNLNGEMSYRGSFADIWNSTVRKEDMGLYGWSANPWVWVIEFDRIQTPSV